MQRKQKLQQERLKDEFENSISKYRNIQKVSFFLQSVVSCILVISWCLSVVLFHVFVVFSFFLFDVIVIVVVTVAVAVVVVAVAVVVVTVVVVVAVAVVVVTVVVVVVVDVVPV